MHRPGSRIASGLAALLATVLSAGTALACELEIDDAADHVVWRGALGDGFRADGPRTHVERLAIDLRNAGQSDCIVHLGIETGGEETRLSLIGPDTLLDLTVESEDLRVSVPAFEAGSGGRMIAPGETARMHLAFRAPNEQHPDAGLHVARTFVLVRVRDELGVVRIAKRRPLRVEARVVARMGLSFARGAEEGAAELDFGTLQEGETQSIDVFVRANAPYRVTARSRNGGVLVNTWPDSQGEVGYAVSVNGRSGSVGRLPRPIAGGRSTGLIADRLALGVTITDNPGVAGDYEDVITLKIESLR